MTTNNKQTYYKHTANNGENNNKQHTEYNKQGIIITFMCAWSWFYIASFELFNAPSKVATLRHSYWWWILYVFSLIDNNSHSL